MTYDDNRDDSRKPFDGSQPGKRKRIITGKSDTNRSSDDTRGSSQPLYSSDKTFKKPYSSDRQDDTRGSSYKPRPFNREGGSSDRSTGYNREGGSSRGTGYNREGGSDRGQSFNREGGADRNFNREGNSDRNFNREGGDRNFNREGGSTRSDGSPRNFNRSGNTDRPSGTGSGYNRESGGRSNDRGQGSSYNRSSGTGYSRGGDRDSGNRSSGSSYNRESGGRSNDRSTGGERNFNRADGGERNFNRSSTGSSTGGERNFNRSSDGKPAFRKPYSGGGDRGPSQGGFKKPYGNNDRRSSGGYSSDRKTGGNDRSFRKPFVKHEGPKTQPEYHFEEDNVMAPIRLNKYIANTGLCSRREADEYIQAGLITVNGVLVTELGVKVQPTDEVKYNNERMQTEKKVYILLNKPKDYVTSVDDPHAKRTVMELIKGACRERIYPVGRLDRMTTGVLLLTNDGELTKKLTHPTSNIKKIYQVHLDKNIKPDDLQAISEGIVLDDGFIQPDSVNYVFPDDRSVVGVEIHSGRNRVVRRIFEYFGYKVAKLDRVYFAALTKKSLQRGHWRYLDPKEVGFLKMLQV